MEKLNYLGYEAVSTIRNEFGKIFLGEVSAFPTLFKRAIAQFDIMVV